MFVLKIKKNLIRAGKLEAELYKAVLERIWDRTFQRCPFYSQKGWFHMFSIVTRGWQKDVSFVDFFTKRKGLEAEINEAWLELSTKLLPFMI